MTKQKYVVAHYERARMDKESFGALLEAGKEFGSRWFSQGKFDPVTDADTTGALTFRCDPENLEALEAALLGAGAQRVERISLVALVRADIAEAKKRYQAVRDDIRAFAGEQRKTRLFLTENRVIQDVMELVEAGVLSEQEMKDAFKGAPGPEFLKLVDDLWFVDGNIPDSAERVLNDALKAVEEAV